MDETNSTDILFQYLSDLLYQPHKAQLDPGSLDEEHQKLGQGMLFFGQMITETRDFAAALAKGNLNAPLPSRQNELAAPLKALHASLRHMTWQTQQVAKGDYQQRVDFMGDFSEAFNTMISQLDHRQTALEQEIERVKKKTMALEQSYTLLQELANLRNEWILVANRSSGEMLFQNMEAEKSIEAGEPLAGLLLDWIKTYIGRGEVSSLFNSEEYIFQLEGKTRAFRISCYPVNWDEQPAITFLFEDVSEQRRQLLQLENIAYLDSLTGLYNRLYGIDTLGAWVEQNRAFCLCFADLDNLKYVNDNFGHNQGDIYIQMAARLLADFSPKGIACRLGGDEFLLLVPDMTAQNAEQRLEEIRNTLETTAAENASPFLGSMSYGVVEVDESNLFTSSELLAKADEKMYEYKRAHKDERFGRTNTKALFK